MKENPTSYLQWVVEALGPGYCLLLVLAGVCSFVMTLLIVRRGKGDMSGVSLLLSIGLPLLVGLLATVHVMIKSMTPIAMRAEGDATPEMAAAIAMSLFPLLLGILLMVPSYLMAMFGSFGRSGGYRRKGFLSQLVKHLRD